MNIAIIIGRLTKDPDIRYGAENQTAVARFNLAIDRGKDKDGESRGTDFPGIICFGKTAELAERFLKKGRIVGIQGRIQTGKYEKDGRTIYTTDVIADKMQFLDSGDKNEDGTERQKSAPANTNPNVPEGFGEITNDDIPF